MSIGAHMSNENYFISRSHCPVCGSKDVISAYKRPFRSGKIAEYLSWFYGEGKDFSWIPENTSFEVLLCDKCELVFQKNVLSEAGTRFFYSSVVNPVHIEVRDALKDIPDDVRMVFEAAINEILKYMIQKNNLPITHFNHDACGRLGLKFLDYGSGTASWAKMVKDYGVNSFGYDINKKAEEYALKKGIPFLKRQDFSPIFDFVNLNQVLEHVTDPKAVIRDAKNLLKEEGIVRITVPSGERILDKLQAENWITDPTSSDSLNAIAPLEHINAFSGKSFLSMLEEFGLNAVEYLPACFVFKN